MIDPTDFLRPSLLAALGAYGATEVAALRGAYAPPGNQPEPSPINPDADVFVFTSNFAPVTWALPPVRLCVRSQRLWVIFPFGGTVTINVATGDTIGGSFTSASLTLPNIGIGLAVPVMNASGTGGDWKLFHDIPGIVYA